MAGMIFCKIYVTSIFCTTESATFIWLLLNRIFFTNTITYAQAEPIKVYAKYSIIKWLK